MQPETKIKFRDAFSRADWFKIGVLLVFSSVAWFYVWQEFQKPLLDLDELETQVVQQTGVRQ
jgi:hypothetical protein